MTFPQNYQFQSQHMKNMNAFNRQSMNHQQQYKPSLPSQPGPSSRPSDPTQSEDLRRQQSQRLMRRAVTQQNDHGDNDDISHQSTQANQTVHEETATTSESKKVSNKNFSELRMLSCRVSRARDWIQTMSSSRPVLLRVYGRVSSVDHQPGNKKLTGRKTLVLEDLRDVSQGVGCYFQEIDRKLMTIKEGDSVVVTGRIDSNSSVHLQIFTAESFVPEQVEPFLSRLENFAIRSLRTN